MALVMKQGIETVRRDGCPALVKMMEKSLRLLFTSRDLSQVSQHASTDTIESSADSRVITPCMLSFAQV